MLMGFVSVPKSSCASQLRDQLQQISNVLTLPNLFLKGQSFQLPDKRFICIFVPHCGIRREPVQKPRSSCGSSTKMQHVRNSSTLNPQNLSTFPLTFPLRPILSVCSFLLLLKPRILVLGHTSSPNLSGNSNTGEISLNIPQSLRWLSEHFKSSEQGHHYQLHSEWNDLGKLIYKNYL